MTAAGYTASDVRATGRIADGRVTIDARANAYGGSAAAKGTLVPAAGERPFAFDLQGQADDVNLKGLPASTGAPALETDLSVASFQVRGHGQTIEGSATLKRSTVEGATVADGTVAQFARQNGAVSYAARGAIADLNVQRLGRIHIPDPQTVLLAAFQNLGFVRLSGERHRVHPREIQPQQNIRGIFATEALEVRHQPIDRNVFEKGPSVLCPDRRAHHDQRDDRRSHD